MTKLDVDFKRVGNIRLLPLDAASFFLPFGRPVSDYLRGGAGRENGSRRLIRYESLEFPIEILWRRTIAAGLEVARLDPAADEEALAGQVQEIEPKPFGFLGIPPVVAAGGASAEAKSPPHRIELSGLRVHLPRADALPLRPKITFAPAPSKVTKPGAGSPAKPVSKSPVPVASLRPPTPATGAKPVVVDKKPAPGEERKAAPVELERKPSELQRKPGASARPEAAFKPETLSRPEAPKSTPEPQSRPIPVVRAEPKDTGRRPEASGAKPQAVADPCPAGAAIAKADPKLDAKPSLVAGPEAVRKTEIPAKTRMGPEVVAKPGAVRPATIPAQPPVVQPPDATAPSAPVTAQKPLVGAGMQTATEDSKPDLKENQKSPDLSSSFPAGSSFLSGAVSETEAGLIARIPLPLKIGIPAVIIGLSGYFLLAGSGSKPAPKAVSSPAAAIAVGEPEWESLAASDAVGSRRGRQLQLYPGSGARDDYDFEFEGSVEAKALGWVFRAKDTSNYYGMKLEISGLGGAVLTRFAVVEGRESSFNQRPLAIDVRPGLAIPVKLEVRGSRFTVSVKGQPVEVWTDNRLSTGAVGFMNERDEFGKAAHVRFSAAEASR